MKSQEFNSRAKDKRFADLRLKVGERASPDKEEVDVPSEISYEDAWGELPRY